MVGKNFAELTPKRSAKVLPLAAMTSTIKVRGEAVGSELENFFQYEFVNYAPSVFDNEEDC